MIVLHRRNDIVVAVNAKIIIVLVLAASWELLRLVLYLGPRVGPSWCYIGLSCN